MSIDTTHMADALAYAVEAHRPRLMVVGGGGPNLGPLAARALAQFGASYGIEFRGLGDRIRGREIDMVWIDDLVDYSPRPACRLAHPRSRRLSKRWKRRRRQLAQRLARSAMRKAMR